MIKKLLLFICSFLSFSLLITTHWFSAKLGDISIENFLFHIFLPADGLSVFEWGHELFLFLSILFVIAILFYTFVGTRKWMLQLCIILAVFSYDIYYIEKKFNIVEYYKKSKIENSFIKNNYVFPSFSKIKFPNEKRNLIVLQIESLENTFQNKKNGGIFPENYIPEITKLSKKHTSLSGMKMLPGTNWTMASVIAIQGGIPFKIDSLKSEHFFKKQTSKIERKRFFPKLITLNDILEKNGYKNIFLLGTPPRYAGQGDFFKQHGNTTVVSLKKEDNAYDADVFEFAKKIISDTKTPFSLFIQTYDTHFDGRLNPTCKALYPKNILNVYRCVSQQLSGFIQWIKKQPIYKNTTVVIIGDHPNMSNVCKLASCTGHTRSPLVIFMNIPFKPKKYEHTFSTFDLFPTILSSIGVKIKGNRLGLGTNLFSSKKTLLDAEGLNTVTNALRKRDTFYNRHFLMGL